MSQPLVSIIIPTYNRGYLIGETLESVLAQTYTNWECIVVDDGSTDATHELLAAYCENDSRFQYHHRPNNRPKGANVCRNYGFELSKGEYIKWLDSDDLLSNELLLAQVNVLNANSSNRRAVGTAKWNFFTDHIDDIKPKINQINKDYKRGFDLICDFGIYNTFLPPHTYLIHKSIILISGLWNEQLLINQDGEFFVRVLLNASCVIHAERGMAYYRYGFEGDNVSDFSTSKKAKDAILSWILIDTYIKVYTKEMKSIKYVENAKKTLIAKIVDKKIINEYRFFFSKKRIISKIKIKETFQFLKKKYLIYNKYIKE